MLPMVAERAQEIDHLRVRWLEGGAADSGNVLVWLHAFPVSAEQWRPQLEAPPPGWRVIAPDLPGFGGSADHHGTPSIDDFARTVDRLLESLDIDRAVVGGLSMGGYSALAWLRVAPARIRALVLADTRAAADSDQARAGRAKLLTVLEREGAAGVAEDMMPKLLGETTRRERPAIVAQVRSLVEGNTPEGLRRGILRLRDRPDSSAVLGAAEVPVLVLIGDEDTVVPVAEAEQLAASVRRGTFGVIPGAGHLSNLENPDAFGTAVAQWLASL